MAAKVKDSNSPVRIKKYANRRLYNTATSSYVTLEDLSQMVQQGVEFVVEDAKTGEDLTRAVLTQIIVEEEQKGQNLLPLSFLRQLISFYGDSMRWMVPQYLENAMGWFTHHQDEMRRRLQATLGPAFPLGSLEEMQRQNMQMFEQAMKMFGAGLGGAKPGAAHPPEPDRAPERPAEKAGGESTIDDLRHQLAQMQAQLDKLSKRDE